MNFASDNWAGAHPKIAEALGAAAQGFAPAYGASDVDRAAIETISALFEREVSVFFVGTGTAANALALSAFAKPGGVTFAHREAHVIEDECGAPEWFSGGGRLCPVEGPLGKMNPAALDAAIRRYPAAFVHGGQPAAITLTQATEAGTVHSLAEIAAISALARQHGLPLHMDGARFANSLVSLSCSPAEMTWKAGVDVLSFGGTKNGCWCAEAVIFFDPAKAADMPFLRKRGAQLFSKSRFIAAQFNAYLENGLWLETASHANAMAARLARAIDASPRATLGWQPEANEVFALVSRELAGKLRASGAVFADWHGPTAVALTDGTDRVLIRLVTSFATTEAEIDRFAALIS